MIKLEKFVGPVLTYRVAVHLKAP